MRPGAPPAPGSKLGHHGVVTSGGWISEVEIGAASLLTAHLVHLLLAVVLAVVSGGLSTRRARRRMSHTGPSADARPAPGMRSGTAAPLGVRWAVPASATAG